LEKSTFGAVQLLGKPTVWILDAALEQFLATRDAYRNVFSEMHMDVADCYSKIGNLHLSAGRLQEAMSMFEASVHIATVLGDPSAPERQAGLDALMLKIHPPKQ
jgi:hypothetical protein